MLKMRAISKLFLAGMGAAILATTFSAGAIAQDAENYPTKPIKIIVGFSAGGTTDAVPRLLAQPMSKILGQPIIVENRPGAGGAIAIDAVAKADPDGYTLLAGGTGLAVLPHTTANMAFNPVTDLEHITMVGEGDQWFSVPTAFPAQNYDEFVAYVKARPGEVLYGGAGAGSNMHLFIEYFKLLAGLDMPAVQYKGGGAIRLDLIANRVQTSLSSLPTIQGFIEDGKLRPILLVGKERDPKYPDVPTVGEKGLKELEVASNWFSLHAPKGTPKPIIDKIYAAFSEALKTEEVQEGLAGLSLRAVGSTPEEFTARINSDYETFGEIVEKAGIEKQ